MPPARGVPPQALALRRESALGLLGDRAKSGRIVDGDVDLIFNTTEGWQSLKDSQSIRATALNRKVPYFTTVAASLAVAKAIAATEGRSLEVRSLQSYYSALER